MTAINKEVSDRLKNLAESRFGQRGRFRLLEEASGITADKWRNLHYGKQKATKEMLNFWINRFPEDEVWLQKGVKPPKDDNFPFSAPIPHKQATLTPGERLAWVIREFATPKGNELFTYLEERSGEKISANSWAQVILGKEQPTLEMVTLICHERPYFLEWVVFGFVYGNKVQVDPTNLASVNNWKQNEKEKFQRLSEALKNTTQNDDQAG